MCDHKIHLYTEIKEYGVVATAELDNVDGTTYLDLYLCGANGDGRLTKTKHRRRKWPFCPMCGAKLSEEASDDVL